MAKVRFVEMLPHELVPARTARPVAYLPLGTLEWHGGHLPYGYDGVKADALAAVFAERTGGVVMPTVWWGDHRGILAEVVFGPDPRPSFVYDHRPAICSALGLTPQAFAQDAERCEVEEGGWMLYESVLTHACHEIEVLGFELILPIAGHYPLIEPARAVAKSYGGSARIHPFIEAELVADQGFKGDHAGTWETSLMMVLRPDLVMMDRILTFDDDEAVGAPFTKPHRTASRELGQRGLAAMTEAVARLVAGYLPSSERR
jgi:creatinine amidohydrolase